MNREKLSAQARFQLPSFGLAAGGMTENLSMRASQSFENTLHSCTNASQFCKNPSQSYVTTVILNSKTAKCHKSCSKFLHKCNSRNKKLSSKHFRRISKENMKMYVYHSTNSSNCNALCKSMMAVHCITFYKSCKATNKQLS